MARKPSAKRSRRKTSVAAMKPESEPPKESEGKPKAFLESLPNGARLEIFMSLHRALGTDLADENGWRARTVADLFKSLDPETAIEGMLSVQMLACHRLAVETAARGTERSINQAQALMRTFTRQIEAMQRLRGRPREQRMVVEHIDARGAQVAIVNGGANGDKQ